MVSFPNLPRNPLTICPRGDLFRRSYAFARGECRHVLLRRAASRYAATRRRIRIHTKR